jgi:hypothetical protein
VDDIKFKPVWKKCVLNIRTEFDSLVQSGMAKLWVSSQAVSEIFE